jgi:hypothetical protein
MTNPEMVCAFDYAYDAEESKARIQQDAEQEHA